MTNELIDEVLNDLIDDEAEELDPLDPLFEQHADEDGSAI
jgi:hypothetical protein